MLRSNYSVRFLLGLGIAALGLLAAGCGAKKHLGVAAVATAGTTTTGGTATTAAPAGDAAGLLAKWADCMRAHGDPNQTDPTIDSQKVIEVTIPASYQGPGIAGKAGNPCDSYMTAASSALMGGQRPQRPDPAKLLAFSQCMRANGIPDFPDPTGGGIAIRQGGDLDPSSPAFKNAQKLCGKKTHITGPLGGGPPSPGMIKVMRQGAPPPGG